MDEWLHNLPVWWMALVIFAIAYLATGGIFAIIMALAKGERVRVFKSVSVSLLPPLGIIFGLLVAFSAVQVWNDIDRAKVAVDREASATDLVMKNKAARAPGAPSITTSGERRQWRWPDWTRDADTQINVIACRRIG
jgi:hypothetical protein